MSMPNNINNNNTKMESFYPFQEAEQYVNLLQENISRMANNSASCKNWLVGIIGGAIAVVFAKDKEELAAVIAHQIGKISNNMPTVARSEAKTNTLHITEIFFYIYLFHF